MKYFARFFMAALCAVPFGAGFCAVPTTRGNNLTAYNGASGSTNNNNWNALMNVRSGSDAAELPTADFGNCNAVILRCAQPKCANGGCTDMNIAATIVNGCVQSNEACKQYGDDLIGYIAAQLVANSTAKANAAQAAAANAAAEQSAQQMAQMQAQMQQMQSEMAAQNAETVAQLQSALDEQKELTAQAIAEAAAARSTPATTSSTSILGSTGDSNTPQQAANGALTAAQQMAAQNGVSADVLAREQIGGQILSSLENAETQLKALKTSMEDAFKYAGCDSKGSGCAGPKRVRTFKEKAMAFFDPYENVLDELYDALITAQAVGVDISDIYMMLNDSCNVWAQYLCSTTERYIKQPQYEIQPDGSLKVTSDYTMVRSWPKYVSDNCPNGQSVNTNGARGGRPCMIGQVIPPEDDVSCTLQKTLTSGEDVQRNWLWEEQGEYNGNIRVGCASSALEASKFFRNRKKGSSLDIDILKRIIEQDAPSVYGTMWKNTGAKTAPNPDGIKYCAVSDETLADLEKIVSLKALPKTVCVADNDLEGMLVARGLYENDFTNHYDYVYAKCKDWQNVPTGIGSATYSSLAHCLCEEGDSTAHYLENGTCKCTSGFTWSDSTLTCEMDIDLSGIDFSPLDPTLRVPTISRR
ncbi:MAG: hypothetical protein J6W40_01835 [Alphaproteobacteria bacterium]|nr:hypothetical protein [Alphaproteobacteria bacterium]